MGALINFGNKQKLEDSSISLSEWIKEGHTDEELRELFFYMDLAMRYLHNKNYSIKSFNPKEIELVNSSIQQIKYSVVLEMPREIEVQRELIKEDIFASAFLQVGIYTNCLEYMYRNPNIVKDEFTQYALFLPQEDVPYYQGVIVRGATGVYFSEYVDKKREQDLERLEKEIASSDGGMGRSLVKSNGHSIYAGDLERQNKINDSIYGQLNSLKEAAFVSFLLFPTIVLILGIVITLIALFFQL